VYTTVPLRYLGVNRQAGYVEYEFHVGQNKTQDSRRVVLTIQSDVFASRELMLQEAPDLCYQKLLAELGRDTYQSSLESRIAVTADDIAAYRQSHPTPSGRIRPWKNRQTASAKSDS
jgi:hypothetical protein